MRSCLVFSAASSEGRRRLRRQLFRNGIFEGVDTDALAAHDIDADPPQIYAYWFEKSINTGLANPIEVLNRIGVEPPIAVLVAVLGGRGYQVLSGTPLADSRGANRIIDRDFLVLPEVILESYPQSMRTELPRKLRPIVDAFWQAGGWPGSRSYDANGEWVEKR